MRAIAFVHFGDVRDTWPEVKLTLPAEIGKDSTGPALFTTWI